MAVRATLTNLAATTALHGSARVSGVSIAAVMAYHYTIRVSGHELTPTMAYHGPVRVTGYEQVPVVAYHAPVRVTGHVGFMVASANDAIYFDLLDSASVLYGVSSFTIEATAAPIPEFNPYRPTIPEALIGLGQVYYDYAKENQEILREQHDLQQAGDTTFPYQLLLTTHDVKQFNLGAIGRFYKEEYGIIHARYVQFDSMVATDSLCFPVGLFKSAKALEWVVTNSLASSSADLVVGMTPQVVRPADGTFGWVITDGPNLQQVVNESTAAKQGEAFAWSSTGKVSNTAMGRVVGRRVDSTKTKTLLVGQMNICLESFSLGTIVHEVEALTSNLLAQITTLQNDVTVLQNLTDLAGTFKALTKSLAAMSKRLDIEEAARKQADTALRNSLANAPFVTTSQFGAAVSQITNSIAAVQASLTAKITATDGIAREALALAQSLAAIDVDGFQTQIAAILSRLANEETRAKGKFPVVDGAIPPNLVYLDDGSLVYEETF